VCEEGMNENEAAMFDDDAMFTRHDALYFWR
jgi:hypothetical protein